MLSPMTTSSPDVEHAHQDVACIHCGLPVPAQVSHADNGPFCCHGCEVAYAILQEDDDLLEAWHARGQAKTQPTYAEMDHEAFRQKYVQQLTSSQVRIELAIENLFCASCVLAIEKLPRFLPGVVESRVNLATSRVKIVWQNEAVPLSEIARTLARLGYPPHPIDDAALETADRLENRKRLIHLAVAGVCAGNAMLVAIAMYYGLFTGMESRFANLFRWVSAGLAIVSLAWPGATFFTNAFRAVRSRTPHMDIPVAVGLAAGTAMGIANTILGRGEIYFDSITVLVFLLLVGRYLQYQQQRKAIRQVSLIKSLIPQAVHRILPAGSSQQTEIIPLEAVQPGDYLQVLIGDLIAADGIIIEGDSAIDCSILTGESIGQPVGPGDTVSAGTTNLTSPLIMKVERIAAETRLAEITRLIELGLESKTPIVQFANSIAGYFVAVVLILAAATFTFWASVDLELAVNHAMALMIVACPCALGLATPFTIAITQARAARRQILIKSGDVLEKLQKPGRLWLDKTGTMTTGRPTLIHWEGDDGCIGGVIAVEAKVIHPLATTLVESLRQRKTSKAMTAERVEALPGLGVRGIVDGKEYVIGSHRILEQCNLDINPKLAAKGEDFQRAGWTTIFVAVDGVLVAVAAIGDSVRPDTKATIEEMRSQGWQIGILSGDHSTAVKKVAQEIALPADRTYGDVSPEDKLAFILEGSENGTTVMVGDGVNDSAALAASGVGIAVEGGAAASLQAADVYLSQPGLRGILELMRGAKQTVRTIHMNFAASLGYNVTAAALAMTGQISPLIAAILMPLSSLTVLSIAFLNPAFRKDLP